MKSARRRSREIALQALYAWQLAGGDAAALLDQAAALEGYERADQEFVRTLIRGVLARSGEIEQLIAPHLTQRSFAQLSPVERAILCIAAFELAAQPQTPFKVIVNEAIELGKSFGGADGYKFVNGVLEKLAAQLRAHEVALAAQARQTA
ncbi:MAG TPA: transcription antitermination factor NusB [Burkholderiales bacterium]|nr:transcription antitermination factor NusB [Burkholderiales bacterium]